MQRSPRSPCGGVNEPARGGQRDWVNDIRKLDDGAEADTIERVEDALAGDGKTPPADDEADLRPRHLRETEAQGTA